MLISDNAKAEISGRVKEILGTLGINNRTSEPHNKNQNFGERGYRDAKRMTNHLLNFSGAPGYAWLLALQYSCFVINHLASERLGWRTPAEWLTGSTPDITALLFFVFFQPVFYREFDRVDDDQEKLGRFVGIAEHVGHALTFKVLMEEAKIISCSLVRPATKTGVFENKKATRKALNIAPAMPNAKVGVKGKTVDVVIPETVTDDDDDEEDSEDGIH